MNMKTLIWAGVGLFLSMTFTTIWISRDLKTIRAHNQQRHLAECARDAQAAGSATTTTTGTGTTGAVVDPLASPNGSDASSPTASTPTAPATAAACPTPAGATANATTTANGQVPATASTDAYGTQTTSAQPATQYQDPNAGYAAAPQADQYGGQQQYQPQVQQPATTAPSYSSTDVGGAAS